MAQKDISINKRFAVELWTEIRRIYESKSVPSYEQIKNMLMAEFALENFPSRSTVDRRAKQEKWKRSDKTKAEEPRANRFDDQFWLCVRQVYESNPKLSHKHLRDLVQNQLQCDTFPTAQAVLAKARLEDWQRVDLLIKRDDEGLRKLKSCVKKVMRQTERFTHDEGQYYDDNQDDGEYGDVDFESLRNAQESAKMKVKNLLMGTNYKKIKVAEVITKVRKQLGVMNAIGDALSDEMVMIHTLSTSPEYLKYCNDLMRDDLKESRKNIGAAIKNYTDLSFSRRENIKMTLIAYGIELEDLKEVDESRNASSMDDEKDFEAQKAYLLEQKERIAQRRQYIESGGLQKDVDAEIIKRMEEMDVVDADYEDLDGDND